MGGTTMTLTHYIGGKLVGLTADFPPSLNYPELTTFINQETFVEYILVGGVWNQIGGAPVSQFGGWKEIGRTTLEIAQNSINVAFTNKRFLMIVANILPLGASGGNLTFNGDSGANYWTRIENQGGTDALAGPVSFMNFQGVTAVSPVFQVWYIANLASARKILTGKNAESGIIGAGNPSTRSNMQGTWNNTSTAITSLDYVTSTNQFDIGSEIVVLGYDGADNDTNGFWEELANVAGDGSSTIIDSGTIPFKKYLWIQTYGGTVVNNNALQFNGNTSAGYNYRRSNNGNADIEPAGAQTQLACGGNHTAFQNMFIVNSDTREKILTGEVTHTANVTGAGNPAGRWELSGKGSDLTPISSIQYVPESTSVNWGTDAFMKIWGHD